MASPSETATTASKPLPSSISSTTALPATAMPSITKLAEVFAVVISSKATAMTPLIWMAPLKLLSQTILFATTATTGLKFVSIHTAALPSISSFATTLSLATTKTASN